MHGIQIRDPKRVMPCLVLSLLVIVLVTFYIKNTQHAQNTFLDRKNALVGSAECNFEDLSHVFNLLAFSHEMLDEDIAKHVFSMNSLKEVADKYLGLYKYSHGFDGDYIDLDVTFSDSSGYTQSLAYNFVSTSYGERLLSASVSKVVAKKEVTLLLERVLKCVLVKNDCNYYYKVNNESYSGSGKGIDLSCFGSRADINIFIIRIAGNEYEFTIFADYIGEYRSVMRTGSPIHIENPYQLSLQVFSDIELIP